MFRHVEKSNEKKESLINEVKLTNRGIIFMSYYILFCFWTYSKTLYLLGSASVLYPLQQVVH